jgi:microcystin-dependent protein
VLYEPKTSFGGPNEGDLEGGDIPKEECVLGEIKLIAGQFYPTNMVPAEGQLLEISKWGGLYNLLGTRYGGDGTSNFALPNLKGLGPGDTNYIICVIGEGPRAMATPAP